MQHLLYPNRVVAAVTSLSNYPPSTIPYNLMQSTVIKYYSRPSITRKSLGPCKLVLDMGS